MLKWILGAILALVVVLAGTCWWGYRKLTAGGDTARVAIAASPERVWTYMTVPDSMRAWQDSTTMFRVTGDSAIAVGDTVQVTTTAREGSAQTRSSMTWVVSRLEAPRIIVWTAQDDSTGHVVIQRTDSIVAMGDSTVLFGTIGSPIMDSLGTADSTGGLARKFIQGGAKLMASSLRFVTEAEFARLKARLEGN